MATVGAVALAVVAGWGASWSTPGLRYIAWLTEYLVRPSLHDGTLPIPSHGYRSVFVYCAGRPSIPACGVLNGLQMATRRSRRHHPHHHLLPRSSAFGHVS